MSLFDFLLHDHVRGNDCPDADSAEVSEIHRNLILSKPLLNKFYVQQYEFFMNELREGPNGVFLELGSGGGFLKDCMPAVVTSDVVPLKSVDRVMSATKLEFDSCSLGAILMVNVFHHISDVESFLFEAERCLVPGGKIIMVEPANTVWSSFFYRNFHHEKFDPEQKSWELSGSSRMLATNGALPWIVFRRDIDRFSKLYPKLSLVSYYSVSPFLYLLSGGVSLRQLCPTFAYPILRGLEYMLSPLNGVLGMFTRTVVVKDLS